VRHGRLGLVILIRVHPPPLTAARDTMPAAMSRLSRAICRAVCLVSLLLFAAVFTLWMRSYGLSDQVAWRRVDGEGRVWSARGNVVFWLTLADLSDGGREAVDVRPVHHRITAARDAAGQRWGLLARSGNRGDQIVQFDRAGFSLFQVHNAQMGYRIANAVVPLGGLAALTALPPLAWLARRALAQRRRRRRARRGLCTACGYDLRGTVGEHDTPVGGRHASPGEDSPRCPECGNPATPPASSFSLIPIHPSLRRLPPRLAAFAAGFALATLIFMAWSMPLSNQHVRNEINWDEHDPIWSMSFAAHQSAVRGDSRRAAAQLLEMLERWNAYRNEDADGPPPRVWYREVIATTTTRPAE
jgi:hypothetical protein